MNRWVILLSLLLLVSAAKKTRNGVHKKLLFEKDDEERCMQLLADREAQIETGFATGIDPTNTKALFDSLLEHITEDSALATAQERCAELSKMFAKEIAYRFYSDADRVSRQGVRDACEAMLEAHASPFIDEAHNEQLHRTVSVLREGNALVGRVQHEDRKRRRGQTDIYYVYLSGARISRIEQYRINVSQ